ncbi:MAG: phosphatase PAP2 family protein [Gaiellaceae bacterium MAG52_C11]|nr:phosphatase PAP2 family protein [Candidatus Gaiellasilicea maunaloa]
MKRDLHPSHLQPVRHPVLPVRGVVASPHRGAVEVAALFGLYGFYQLIRGFGELDFESAQRNTEAIVAAEQRLQVFVERGVQDWALGVPGLAGLLGVAYLALHLVLTPAVLVWVYRAHRDRFPLVRTTLVVSTALALVGYVVYPAAPPRLADLGFTDTVSEGAHLNLSSDLLGSFYNPIAAVPSLHFGYALLVGGAVAWLARRRALRLVGAVYPAVMLFIIVATGNHFLLDAVAGGAVVLAGWAASRLLIPARREPVATAARTQRHLERLAA